MHPRRPSTLAAEIGLSRPALSRQLRLLHDADLVQALPTRADRRGLLYMINPRMHGRITAWLAGTDVGRPVASPWDFTFGGGPPGPASHGPPSAQDWGGPADPDPTIDDFTY